MPKKAHSIRGLRELLARSSLLKTLRELHSALGERRVSVSREITKKFEETVRGSFDEVIAHFEARAPKGEFVIVVEGARATKDTDETE